jgi:hypothetical protein
MTMTKGWVDRAAISGIRPAETLLRHGSGTCAPKHALLAREYERRGVPMRFVYVTSRLDDMQSVRQPKEVQHG